MEHPVNHDIKRTVVYTVKVVSCNPGAWYKDNIRQEYDCILELNDQLFRGHEIMFRVLGAFHPVKFIKQQHCIVIKQHIADHNELLKFYGSK